MNNKGREELARKAGQMLAVESIPARSPELTERIMKKVRSMPTPSRAERDGYWFRSSLRLVGGLAGVLVLGIGGWLLLSMQQAGRVETTTLGVETSFSFIDAAAKSVMIAGDFTGWQRVKMDKRGDRWSVSLPLAEGGTYRYVFFVDGRCQADPAAAVVVADDFGCENSLIAL